MKNQFRKNNFQMDDLFEIFNVRKFWFLMYNGGYDEIRIFGFNMGGYSKLETCDREVVYNIRFRGGIDSLQNSSQNVSYR